MASNRTVGYQAAAKHLGITVGALRSRVARKTIPHRRVTTWIVRFDLDELDRWMSGTPVPATGREAA